MEISEQQRKELEEKLKNMSPEEVAALQQKQCIFCQIITGAVPSKKVYEDDLCYVVLDINPAAKGHCLILPKRHYSIMPQVPDNELSHLFIVAKEISQILLKAMKVDGTTIFVANGLVAGQRANHFMIHIIPRKSSDSLFEVDTNVVDLKTREEILSKVKGYFNQLMGIKEEKQEKLVEKESQESDEYETGELEDADADQDNSQEESDQVPDEISQEDEDLKDGDEEEPEEDEDDVEDSKDESKKGDEKEDVSLDDIANLFK